MITVGHRLSIAIVAGTAVSAALWSLLFAGPWLFNAHSDAALVLAVMLYLGVPAGLGWGAMRIKRFLDPKDRLK